MQTPKRSPNRSLPRFMLPHASGKELFEHWQQFLQSHQVSLPLRRCAAWTVEVMLIAASAWVPYQLGAAVNRGYAGNPAPLHPVLVGLERVKSYALGHSPLVHSTPSQRQSGVAPLANWLWLGAAIAPVGIALWQWLLLGKHGQTLPKQWLGVRVVVASGASPGVKGALLREGVGRWGAPLAIAYVFWRISWLFPGGGALLVLGAIALASDGLSARFHPRRRTFHDRLAGTYVLDAMPANPRTMPAWNVRTLYPNQHQRVWDRNNEDAAIAAIVLSRSSEEQERQTLWRWMLAHPGTTLVIATASAMAAVLGTYIWSQIYIQGETTKRTFKQQDNEVFLSLVGKLTPTSPDTPDERRNAILALGAIDDTRAISLLVGLLGQESSPETIDAIHQALVSWELRALPELYDLNRVLHTQEKELSYGGAPHEQIAVALRQRATKRAIAKILTVNNGKIPPLDFKGIDLGQVARGRAQFTLVLDRVELPGINFRSAALRGASLLETRFTSAGSDGRLGTLDDAIGDLSGADLQEANLTRAFLNYALLQRTSFVRANLSEASLSLAKGTGANFSHAVLTRANLNQGNWSTATLTQADLTGASFLAADLTGANGEKAIAPGSQFAKADLTDSIWKGTDFSGANFQGAILFNTNLSATKWMGADLRDADLQNANFEGATIGSTDLRGANVAGANFAGVTFAAPTGKEATIPAAGFLAGVDFSRVVNLTPTQIDQICAQGGVHPNCP